MNFKLQQLVIEFGLIVAMKTLHVTFNKYMLNNLNEGEFRKNLRSHFEDTQLAHSEFTR